MHAGSVKFGTAWVRATFGNRWITVAQVAAAAIHLIPPEEAIRVRRNQNSRRRAARTDSNQKAGTHDEKITVGVTIKVTTTLIGMYYNGTADRRSRRSVTEYRPRPPGPKRKPAGRNATKSESGF